MAEDGFKLFLEYLQSLKEPPKPKRVGRPPKEKVELPPIGSSDPVQKADPPLPPPQQSVRLPIPLQDEDYTEAVCLLHSLTKLQPYYLEALVDAADLTWITVRPCRIARVNSRTPYLCVQTGSDYLARVIMQAPKGMVVDHRNHNPLDNRRRNLRICTQGQNVLNNSNRKNGSSRFKGVWLDKGRWRAQAGRRGQVVSLGLFDSEEDAATAYNEFARKAYGEFAVLNPV